MARRFSSSFVPVAAATSDALEDAGEQRSPKYAPATIAPAVTAVLTPPERASAMRMIPAVPTTPKDVPSAYDRKHVSANVTRMNSCGVMICRPW